MTFKERVDNSFWGRCNTEQMYADCIGCTAESGLCHLIAFYEDDYDDEFDELLSYAETDEDFDYFEAVYFQYVSTYENIYSFLMEALNDT